MRAVWWLFFLLMGLTGEAWADGFSFRWSDGDPGFRPGHSRHGYEDRRWEYVDPYRQPWRYDGYRDRHWPERHDHRGRVVVVQPVNSCEVGAYGICGGCSVSCPDGEAAYCTPGQERVVGSYARCVRFPSCSCR